ncbi:unnamed protein product [Thelazia callipaeda]|uniref:Calponin-homology (CH) domain-containing protein n=1 Tax=Thelazia callipaeda TaxID=103827 RepID=A0A158RD10_THECL|nr:unnamed protein product [Thelazia callipaeda]
MKVAKSELNKHPCLFYPISSTPLSRSSRCNFSQSSIGGGSPIDGNMLPRSNRPRDLRVIPASPFVVTRTNESCSTPMKHSIGNKCTSPCRVHATIGGSPGTTGGAPDDDYMPAKMMVAPQPQSANYRERNDSSQSKSLHYSQQRRQSMGAIIPAHVGAFAAGDWRYRDHESPLDDQQLAVDNRRIVAHNNNSNNNDMRVAVLEQRVRELEAAMITGQASSSVMPASLIIPVIGSKNKNSSRILRSASGQFVVSAASASTTQQLMAQEVVDREIEVERLQSQLRKCYSRMELRQVQYDEEVNSFRLESEEAKAQLSKVKCRLNELEKECVAYREKAMTVDADRNNAIVSSLEKISAQEREILALKNELDRQAQIVKDLEQVKKEYNFLELQNEALNSKLDNKEATIHELEERISAMKVDAHKQESGSVMHTTDSFSLLDFDTTKISKKLTKIQVQKTKNDSTPPKTAGKNEKSLRKISRSTPSLASNNPETDEKIQDQISLSASELAQKQLNLASECRILAKCLKDVAVKAIAGNAPRINRLLGCRSDSMSESESEPEQLSVKLNPTPSYQAEQYVKIVTYDLERIERDLNCLRKSFVVYYQKKIAHELDKDSSCRIQ